jgi:ferredoxin--NADP+ reductase
MDVARLLARSAEDLAGTDIAGYALERLCHSQVKDIHIVARRGPVQARFTNPELREIGNLPNVDVVVDDEDLQLDPYSLEALQNDTSAAKNVEILRELARRGATGRPRRVHFHFLVSPVELLGNHNRVVGLKLEKNELRLDKNGRLNAYGTGRYEVLPVGLVFRSIGYQGVPLPGVPFNEKWGIIPNEKGRVLSPQTSEPILGEYAVGWAKRGPTGVIGTNKPDAAETVAVMLEDVPKLTPVPDKNAEPYAVNTLLKQRKIFYVTFEDWTVLNQIEVKKGEETGRPRVKFTAVEDMLEVVRAARAATVETPAIISASPVSLTRPMVRKDTMPFPLRPFNSSQRTGHGLKRVITERNG